MDENSWFRKLLNIDWYVRLGLLILAIVIWVLDALAVTALLAIPGQACAQELQLPALDAFGQRAARAFSGVAKAPIASKLPTEGLAVISGQEGGSPFTGDVRPGKVSAVTCEKSQILALVAGLQGYAQVAIGECTKEASRVREGAEGSKGEAEELLRALPQQTQQDLRESADWERVSLADGKVGYAYTLLAAGHGFAMISTAVLYDEAHGIVYFAQGDFLPLCFAKGRYANPYSASSPICPHPSRALLEVTKALAKTH